MKSQIWRVGALLATLLVIGSSYAYRPISTQEMQSRLALFDYDKASLRLQEYSTLKEKDHYSVREGKLQGKSPINGKPFVVPFQHYRPHEGTNRPLIVIHPTIHGMSVLEERYADHFADHGYEVLISLLPDDVTDVSMPTENLTHLFIRGVVATRMLIDLGSAMENVDRNRIAILGASLGGIRTALIAGIETRVKAVATVAAGGDLPYVMSLSADGKVTNYRNTRMAEEHIATTDAFRIRLEETLMADPFDFVTRRKSSDIFMIIGTKDTYVPTFKQIELWEKWGRPAHIDLPLSHVQTCLSSVFYLDELDRFFAKRLNLPLEHFSR